MGRRMKWKMRSETGRMREKSRKNVSEKND
jgi:hypothetical protein